MGAEHKEEVKPAKKEREPSFFTLSNPARVIPSQVKFISLSSETPSRYTPVHKNADPIGILMLIDADPSAAEEVSKVERVNLGQTEEAAPPEPFEWGPNDV